MEVVILKKICSYVLLFSLLTAIPAVAESREILKDFHESFDVGENSSLRIKHGDGDVRINHWDKDVVDITVHYHAEYKGLGHGKDRDFTVEFREKNGVIEVAGKESGQGFIGFNIYIVKEYTYTILAPHWLNLDIQGDDGDIEIEKWTGSIECRIDDGDINLFECKAPRTRIRCEDGNIILEEHEGTLDMVADDADVDINRSKFDDCRIQLHDGDITIRNSEGDFDLELDDGDTELFRIITNVLDLKSDDGDFSVELLKTDLLDLEIRTIDGDITLSLQKGISATFNIDVDDGRIRADLPSSADIQKGRHWMSGTILDGKGKIRIRTDDGSVTIREIR
jgi:DUF4097 and DUF4098 domain-containing protein YvlB